MSPGGSGNNADNISHRFVRKNKPSERRNRTGQQLHSASMISSDRKAQNSFSRSPDSSDDNTNKMSNMKDLWYDKNISSEDVRSVKSCDNISNYRKQGAIPKRYYNYNRGTDSGGSMQSNIASVSRYKWERIRNCNTDQDSRSAKSMNKDTNSSRKNTTNMPFYYSVPEDPAEADALPPGRYLVVPLNCIRTRLADALSQTASEKAGKAPGIYSAAKENNHSKKKNNEKVQVSLNAKVSQTEENSQEVNPSTANLDALLSDVDIFTDSQQNKGSSVPERRPAYDVLKRLLDALPHRNINDDREDIEALKTESDVDEYIARVRRDEIAVIKQEFPKLFHEEAVRLFDLYKGRSQDLLIEAQKIQENREQEEHKSRQIAFMCSTIPDADPEFMIQKYEELHGNEGQISSFLDSLIDSKDYPKVEESVYKEKENWWKYYISNFSIEKFLERVPDPSIFTSDQRTGHMIPTEAEMTFLERRYPFLNTEEISNTFTTFNYNLTKTCQHLNGITGTFNPVERTLLKLDFGEDFLKEVSYILHAREINRYLTEKEDRKLAETEWAKEENTFLECIACYDDRVIPSDVLTCPEGHITCRPCLAKYLEVLYADGKYKFSCFDKECTSEYTDSTIRKAVREIFFSKIMTAKASQEVDRAAIPGLEKCPACGYAYIPDPENKIFDCANESCRLQTCRLCREPSHIPLRCREIQRPKDLTARKKIEEAMTNKLLRECPTCRKKFVKVDGCNKMQCVCGTLLCYVCRSIINGYDHFRRNLFGGNNDGRCPLYSNNEELHVNEVVKAGREEKDRILNEDPDIRLDHDPTTAKK